MKQKKRRQPIVFLEIYHNCYEKHLLLTKYNDESHFDGLDLCLRNDASTARPACVQVIAVCNKKYKIHNN